MSLFTVDEEKCKRDSLCVAECPVAIIEMKSKESFPSPVSKAEELCIHCGHCVAVCPHGAMRLDTMMPEDCRSVGKDLMIHADQVEDFFRRRRSIRNYQKRTVDRSVLTRLIEMARYAPSSHNAQPAHWLVIEHEQDLRRLTGLVIDWMRVMIADHPEIAQPMHFDRVVTAWERGQDRVLRGAPHLIVAHADASHMPAQTDCAIALTYLELAAFALGLGACWAGYFNRAANLYPLLKQELDLPAGHAPFGAMMVGYPTFAYHRIPLRNDPRIRWRGEKAI